MATTKTRKSKPKAASPEDLNWEKAKAPASGATYYRHNSGEWVVEAVEALGYNGKALKKPRYAGRYVGQARTESPTLASCPTVIRAKQSVQKFIDYQASKTDDLREKAVLSLRLGRTALAIDIVFDYIDMRFDALERRLDKGGNADG